MPPYPVDDYASRRAAVLATNLRDRVETSSMDVAGTTTAAIAGRAMSSSLRGEALQPAVSSRNAASD